jgi:hypothetical protein
LDRIELAAAKSCVDRTQASVLTDLVRRRSGRAPTLHDLIMNPRTYALSLPEAQEHSHHGMPSFRVRGKIFATMPDDDHMRVMAGESEILAAVAEEPASCEQFYWGNRLACVVVNVRTVSPGLMRNLLAEAWRRKAPKSLWHDLRPDE